MWPNWSRAVLYLLILAAALIRVGCVSTVSEARWLLLTVGRDLVGTRFRVRVLY